MKFTFSFFIIIVKFQFFPFSFFCYHCLILSQTEMICKHRINYVSDCVIIGRVYMYMYLFRLILALLALAHTTLDPPTRFLLVVLLIMESAGWVGMSSITLGYMYMQSQ